jgi:TonB family protein
MMATTCYAMRRLTPALAASTAAHLALLVVLVASVSLTPATIRNAATTLSIVLVPPQPTTNAPAVEAHQAVVVAEKPAPAPAATIPRPPLAPAPALPSAAPARNILAPAVTGARAQARVEYAATTVLGRLGEAMQTRSLLEFPPEIDRPVRPFGAIDVEYPPAALEDRREATVVAWIVVDATGRVDEIAIIEGGPEFGEPVQNALLMAKFLPARNEGKPIRHFTMLEFRFRIDTADAVIVQPR